jgi:hypothetical protein
MSDQFILVDVQGLEELNRKMARFPDDIQGAITEQVASYLLNVFQTEQPTPNHSITRARAYPETGDGFFTPKQRKWFFWALRNGIIQVPYRRTQATRRAWHIIGNGKNAMVANETAGAFFSKDNDRQARLNALVGWTKISEDLRKHDQEIVKQAVIGLKKGMKKAGFKTV